jgi:hypothetical protein
MDRDVSQTRIGHANADPWRPAARVPTQEEIRFAQALRQQIRDRYLRPGPSVVTPWCVGCD